MIIFRGCLSGRLNFTRKQLLQNFFVVILRAG